MLLLPYRQHSSMISPTAAPGRRDCCLTVVAFDNILMVCDDASIATLLPQLNSFLSIIQ